MVHRLLVAVAMMFAATSASAQQLWTYSPAEYAVPIWQLAKELNCKRVETVECSPRAGARCEPSERGGGLIIDFARNKAFGGSIATYDIVGRHYVRQGTAEVAYEMLLFLKAERQTDLSGLVSLRYGPQLRARFIRDVNGFDLSVVHLECERG